MTILDAPLRRAARSVLETFGKQATLRTVVSTYDPAAGEAVDVPTDVSVRALIEDYSALQMMGGSSESGEGVLRGDRKATIAAEGIPEPTPASRLVVDGQGWGVVKVDREYSGDLPVLYVLQIRR